MKKHSAVLGVIALLVLTASAHAHHPFAAEYDWTKPVSVTGTVNMLEWANPHASLQVNGKDESGQTKLWTFEMGSPSALTHAGWPQTTLKKGDMITVEGWMSRTDKNRANAKSVKLSNGKELSGASSIGEVKAASK